MMGKIIVGVLCMLGFIFVIYLQFNPILNHWQMILFGMILIILLIWFIILVNLGDEKNQLNLKGGENEETIDL